MNDKLILVYYGNKALTIVFCEIIDNGLLAQNVVYKLNDYPIQMKWEIIQKFSAENRNCFSFRDVITEYPDKDHSHLSKVLAAMVRSGMLMKLSRDVYHIVPLGANPQTHAPDPRLVAKYMMKVKDYYIAYSSAMSMLGLIPQPGFKAIVVTNRQVRPPMQNIAGTKIQFIYHTCSRFLGYEQMWVTNQEQAMVSDLEKTIVDAVSKPHLCRGIIEIGKAIYHSKGRADLRKLFYYLSRNRSQASKKRYLFSPIYLE
jgi:predicted transcriptional regulator of viral defense system